MSSNIFNRKEKVLFGVCSNLASKFSFNPLSVRIIFIIITLLILPLGVILYLILAIAGGVLKKKISLSIFGAILGLPLSYYFQSEVVRNIVGGFGGYIKHFFDIIIKNSDFSINIIPSVVIFAVIGGIVGYFIDASKAKKSE